MAKTLQSTSENQLVSSLITEGGQQWNEAAIRNRFTEDTVEKILSIPLSTEGYTDFASWPHTKNGIYTVRSVYNLARTMNFLREESVDGKGSTSEQKPLEKMWKKLWAIQCPNKMKVVLWRLAHDCLPTGYQLQVRYIPTSYNCYFCNREETVEHCFFSIVTMLKKSWKNLKRIMNFA
mgnify:CR=1 FL=1